MTDTGFSIGTFNVKNLIGPGEEYYEFQKYTEEEHAWKIDWLSDQLLSMDADIIGFQEIFDQPALERMVEETNAKGVEINDAAVPDASKRYARKAIFKKLKFVGYDPSYLFWAPNMHDTGEAGRRRPGIAVLSRFPFLERPDVFQDFRDQPLEFAFPQLGGDGEAGVYRVDRLSRPVLRARIDVHGKPLTLFNCHLKSKLGEFVREEGAEFAPEENLLDYDPVGRALGELRSLTRRTAEAVILRRLVVEELQRGVAVAVLGDFNDSEHSVSSAVIAGERPFKNYQWLLRHDAQHGGDRYKSGEDARIREAIAHVRLHSAEKIFVRKSLRDMVYTSAFGGVYESIDQIMLSRHFDPEDPDREGDLEYLQVLNDHLTDGSHPEAPYNKLASDHGQLVAQLRWR